MLLEKKLDEINATRNLIVSLVNINITILACNASCSNLK